MRDRNPGIGRYRHGCGHSGNDLKLDPCRRQRLCLFAASTKHERISSF
jgi:hypothetical protein